MTPFAEILREDRRICLLRSLGCVPERRASHLVLHEVLDSLGLGYLTLGEDTPSLSGPCGLGLPQARRQRLHRGHAHPPGPGRGPGPCRGARRQAAPARGPPGPGGPVMAASTMRRLPRQVLDAVNRLLEEGRTIDEVTAFLQEMGAEVSRSSVGRYRKQWAEAVRDLAEVREFSRTVVAELSKQPESRMARLNTELMEAALFQCMSSLRALSTEDPEKAVKLITKAAMAQMLLSKARRDDSESIIKADDYAERKEKVFETVQADNVFTVQFVDKEKSGGA